MDDIGLFGLNNARDVYKKLEREYQTIKKEYTNDSVINFIITADSMKEWVSKDKSLSKDIRKQFAKLYNTDQYKLISDMANRAKHVERIKSKKGISKDKLIPSWDFSDLDFSNVSFGASVFESEYNGKRVDILNEIDILFENIKKVFSHYK